LTSIITGSVGLPLSSEPRRPENRSVVTAFRQPQLCDAGPHRDTARGLSLPGELVPVGKWPPVRGSAVSPAVVFDFVHWSPSGAASTSSVSCGRIHWGRAAGLALLDADRDTLGHRLSEEAERRQRRPAGAVLFGTIRIHFLCNWLTSFLRLALSLRGESTGTMLTRGVRTPR
jgi:hypothetical protein